MTIFRQVANIEQNVQGSLGIYNSIIAGEQLNAPISFISKGYASTLSFTATDDITATNFIIIGTFNNKTLTEVVSGIDGVIVSHISTVNLYHEIISIIATNDVGGIGYLLNGNENVAVVLPNYNLAKDNNTKYKILINSLTTLHNWDSPNVLIYGIMGTIPPYLTLSSLTYNTRNNNFYAVNDPTVDITVDELQRGFITSINYPFAGIIVCFLDAVNDTPSFVEITQS